MVLDSVGKMYGGFRLCREKHMVVVDSVGKTTFTKCFGGWYNSCCSTMDMIYKVWAFFTNPSGLVFTVRTNFTSPDGLGYLHQT